MEVTYLMLAMTRWIQLIPLQKAIFLTRLVTAKLEAKTEVHEVNKVDAMDLVLTLLV